MRKAKVLSRVAISAILMAYLLGRTEWRDLASAFRGASLPLLVVALLLHVPGYWLSAVRWRVLLRAQGGDVTVGRLVASYLVGTFFNNLLPTGIGGDVSRVYDTRGSAGGAARSVAVILVERGSGLVSVVLIGCVATLLPWPSGLEGFDGWLWVALGFVVAGFTVVLSPRLAALAARTLRRLRLRGAGEVLADVAERVAHFRNEGRTLATTFALSLLLQANVVLHCALVACSLHTAVPWLFFAKAVPAVTLVLFLPVSMGGLGVRENAWVWLLASEGVGGEGAIAYSLVMLAMVFLPAAAGGIVFAARRVGRTGGAGSAGGGG